MNRTIKDSKEFDVVFMSFGKEKGKEIEVVEANKKDSFIIESMEIKAVDCNSKDMKFTEKQIKQLIENRKARKTARSLAKTNVSQR